MQNKNYIKTFYYGQDFPKFSFYLQLIKKFIIGLRGVASVNAKHAVHALLSVNKTWSLQNFECSFKS